MDTREKLIDLIYEALYSHSWDFDDHPDGEAMADILIANGIIVPPVKVGQKVYTIPRSAIREWTVCGVWISADPKCSYLHMYWEKNGHHMGSCVVNFSDIDRCLFLTREEAEDALEPHKMPLPEPPKGE